MQHKTAILLIFLAYLAMIPNFAVIYFFLYRKRPTNFVFVSDISSTRLIEETSSANQKEKWLKLLLSFVKYIPRHGNESIDLQRSRHSGFETIYTTTFRLDDGRSIQTSETRLAAPQAGVKIFYPDVKLIGSDGSVISEGSITGYGKLSDYDNWRDYFENLTELLPNDIQKTESRIQELLSPNPSLWRFLDFLYFSTITQSTVGYGDMLPNCTAVRTVVIAQVLLTYGLLVYVLNIILST